MSLPISKLSNFNNTSDGKLSQHIILSGKYILPRFHRAYQILGDPSKKKYIYRALIKHCFNQMFTMGFGDLSIE